VLLLCLSAGCCRVWRKQECHDGEFICYMATVKGVAANDERDHGDIEPCG
jgi:hypothetical protein